MQLYRVAGLAIVEGQYCSDIGTLHIGRVCLLVSEKTNQVVRMCRGQ